MQLRAGATVGVDGVNYEVRRANVRFAFGAAPVNFDLNGAEIDIPQARTAEDPAGEPAMVISGIGQLPEGWDIAQRSIEIACGFDIETEGDAMGFGYDQGTRPGGDGTDIYYPLSRCPGLDG
jgi:hypothetical protein